MNKKEYKEILKLCEKAMKKNCTPIGAIVVKNNKIIGKGYNKKNITHNPLDHAEIIAIKQATKRQQNWRLNDCVLIVSMKPCEMCKHVIYETRIKKILYIIDNKEENYKTKLKEEKTNFLKVNEQMYEKEIKNILNSFFSEKRNKVIR